MLDEISELYPDVDLSVYQVWRNRPNMQLLLSLVEFHEEPLGTPALFVGDRYWIGFSEAHRPEIESVIRRCLDEGCPDPLMRMAEPDKALSAVPGNEAESVTIPLLGQMNAKDASLPMLTLTLGLLDSINPCAFFVLLFLLGLLVHAHSRSRMLMIGGIFVFFSGLIYFLFMTAWLNLFLLVGGVQFVTLAAGLVALVIAIVNIKDFFLYKKGVSLSMSDAHRNNLTVRIRSLVHTSRLPVMLFGTVLLAIAANSYELLCTAGFPMVFTRVLTLHDLAPATYYLYLVAYNLIYVLPLTVIVIVFSCTLGVHKLSEWQGRELKLASGMMMLVLGLVLLIMPELLGSVPGAAGMLGISLAMTVLIILYYKAKHPEVVRSNLPTGHH